MPAMTAREFVDEIAVPTVLEFKADPTQRRGYLACLAAYHVCDYLKPAGERWATSIQDKMKDELGAPFLALWRMADAVKHREKVRGKRGAQVVLMQSGSDTPRPATGFDVGEVGVDMNPGGGVPGNPIRFDDYGGRYVEDGGRFFDMLDLCVIALQGYAKLYPSELSGSAIDSLHYSPAEYTR